MRSYALSEITPWSLWLKRYVVSERFELVDRFRVLRVLSMRLA